MEPREEKRWIAGVPALLVHGGRASDAAARGCILLHHGLRSSKEDNRKELTSLALRGFLAVGLDAVGHGERRWDDFDRRFEGGPDDVMRALLDVVAQTTSEVPRVVDALRDEGLMREGRLGVVGISMGGYVAYGAALRERRLKAVAPILASPIWEGRDDSPHHRPDAFWPIALLSQNAGLDENVPPASARAFHDELRPRYAEQPARLGHVEYPDSAHFMRGEDWDLLWGRVLEFLERWV